MTKHGMAWNEFFPEEEIQVAKIACQDNADRFSLLPELSTASLFQKAPQ
jgi:hypothetical protein